MSAFKQLFVRSSERRYLAGYAADGWFVYLRVLFGVKSGPLVWARFAALVMRVTASTLQPTRTRVQTFVDDPLVTLRGTPKERRMQAVKILWLWTALGLQISWDKGSMSTEAQWIGAYLSLNNADRTITVTLPEDKMQEYGKQVSGLVAQGTCRRKVVQQVAGKLNWAGGLLVQLRPFTRTLHAAIKSPGDKRGNIYRRQLLPACEWIGKFFEQNDWQHWGLVKRTTAGLRHTTRLRVVVDASPWGGGALLMESSDNWRALPPRAYCTIQWTSHEEKMLGTKVGDPAGQALYEAYMALVAIRLWLCSNMQGRVQVIGDAQGVLIAFAKRAAGSPMLNKVTQELALLLGKNFLSLDGIHVYSEFNDDADALSRLCQPGASNDLPPSLQRVQKTLVPAFQWVFL